MNIWTIINNHVFLIYLTSAGLLTTLTGSIFYGLWFLSGKKLDQTGSREIRYQSLTGIALLYIVPIVYMLLIFILDEPLFYNGLAIGTDFQFRLCRWLSAIWAAGFSGCLAYAFCKGISFHRRYRNCMDCDRQTEELFQSICRELGIKEGRVTIKASYYTEVPFQTGLLRPRIILPVELYTEEKLRIFLIHELTHLRQKALLFRKLAHLAAMVNWYNYFAWHYYRKVVRWTEYECDAVAAGAAAPVVTYFNTLLEMAAEQNGIACYLGTSFSEKKSDVVDRIRQACIFHDAIPKKWMGRLILVIMLSLSVALSGTAAYAYGVAHIRITDATFEGTELEPCEITVPEIHTVYGLAEGFAEEFGEMEVLAPDRANYFEWTVGNRVRRISGDIPLTKGQTVTISGSILPAGVYVNVGLIDSTNHVSYVTVQGNVSTNFYISATDTYRFYVENSSGTTVSAYLSMIII